MTGLLRAFRAWLTGERLRRTLDRHRAAADALDRALREALKP